MTLRDYFIAHAPAEPQSWFEPDMPVARPQLPEFPTGVDASTNDVEYVREHARDMKPSDVKDLTLREYVASLAERRLEARNWDNEAASSAMSSGRPRGRTPC
jgi:hypothetical protein